MRLHRFYTTEALEKDSRFIIHDSGTLHQWRNVFRYKAGDSVILFDGSGDDFVCEIISLGKNEAEIKIVEKKKGVMPDREVWLFASLIKKDNFEMILQKCTEIGVSNFVPIISERSEKKGINTERAKKIIVEASEQCGRSVLPVLHETISLEKALDFCDKNKIIPFIFDSSGEEGKKIKTEKGEDGLFIGPEGGWSDKEMEMFKEQNSKIISIGRTALRAETAAIISSWFVTNN